MSWKFVIGDEGRLDYELAAARTRKMKFQLNDPAEASFTIKGRHPHAAQITELVTDLHVFRGNSRLYRGRVDRTRDDLGANRHTVQVGTIDYRGLLDRRILYDSDQLVWAATDQASIAADLVAQTQARTGGDWGITPGIIPAGQPRDRTYEPGKRIGEAIQQLGEVIDGFDWEIDHNLQLNIWHPERGTDNDVVLDFGGLVKGVMRNVDPRGYANAGRYTGDDTLAAETREVADLAARPEGRFDEQHGYTDITLQPTLAERADWQLDQDSNLQPSYTLTLKPGRWDGPDHIWLGDTCRTVIRSGRLQVDTQLRVHTIDIDVDEEGREDVQITVGGPRPDFRKRLTNPLRRLEELERR